MPNDAKLGLLFGVGVVIAVAAVYFRKDTAAAPGPAGEPAAAVQAPTAPAAGATRVAKGKTTSLRHTVAEGETLFTLAERYYHDKGKFATIYQANRAHLRAPDELAPGTVLVIPGVAEKIAPVTDAP